MANAHTEAQWQGSPDIKLNMISYLGFPLNLPNNQPFATLCILDNKENFYCKDYIRLIDNFRDIIQYQLELIYMNSELGDENNQLSDYLEQKKILRGIIPICSFCRKIRDDDQGWVPMDTYAPN